MRTLSLWISAGVVVCGASYLGARGEAADAGGGAIVTTSSSATATSASATATGSAGAKLVAPAAGATAEKPATEKNTGKAKPASPAWFTPEREAAALTFVRAHHSELADLLARLKERRPHEYQKAVRDLFRVSERLTESRERRPERYELELQEWKLQSRVQLLVARMTMGRTPELEHELRGLLNEQLDLRREIVRLDRDRATARLQTLQKELDDLDARREQLLQERWEKAVKSTAVHSTGVKSTGAKKQSPPPTDAK